LVMLNSTRTELAPTTFACIITVEALLSIITLLCIPLVSEAVYNAGVIHRNFRIQVRLVSVVILLCISSRFVLLYYQLFDLPLEDNDIVLVIADIVRDSSFGYICGLPVENYELTFSVYIPYNINVSHGVNSTADTIFVFFTRYERQTPDTMIVIFLIELSNVVPSVANSTGWLFGYFSL
ncbi:hypothetical protein PFISCL1PPCAC_2794, partial [Pristionchus fissidentatus]